MLNNMLCVQLRTHVFVLMIVLCAIERIQHLTEDEFYAIPGRKYTGMMYSAHKHATHYVCLLRIVGLRVLVTLAGATERPSEVFTDTCRLLSCTQHVDKSTCSIPPKT
jgi:hypothetical protein